MAHGHNIYAAEALYCDTCSGIAAVYVAGLERKSIMVHVLATLRADVNLADNDGITPTFIVAQYGYSNAVQVFGNLGADLNKARPLTLKSSGSDSDHSPGCQQVDNRGFSPAFIAAGIGHSDTIRVLGGLKADLNQT